MENETPGNVDLANSIREEFRGDERPVTVEMLARNYAALIEQQEVSMAMYVSLLQSNPDIVFTDNITALRRRMSANIQGLASDIAALDEGRKDE